MYCVNPISYGTILGFSLILNFVFGGCWIGGANCWGQTSELSFTLAPGLTIQKVADESLVKWPMLADWDLEGRLVVVESAGVANPIEKHNELRLHRIVRLVDEDGDGVMDRRIVAADKLPFTEGVLCFGNDMLVTAPPHIWKLTDNDGDGYCEQREIWFDGQTITGCANDLHGPYLGRDGWVYWCKGAFARQTHDLIGGKTLADEAAHIYRRRLFGLSEADSKSSLIEPVMSGGMDNPVDVASLPNGERFFTSTFLVHPGDGKRDGVAHAIYGGAYGKDHAALDGVVRTGSLMPIMAQMGAVAPSGLACLDSSRLVEATSPTLVAALFNMQKVTALTLEPRGATYQATPVDLVVGSRVDFHPTDVLEDADGSLLVIDTGGWYDLCCPTSQVDQFTAPGGIYRVRREGQVPAAAEKSSIDWTSVSADEVVKLLSDTRPWIARNALIKIACSGDWATNSLRAQVEQNDLPLPDRVAAMWALGAAGETAGLEVVSRQLTRHSANADDVLLRQIACNLVSLHRYQLARQDIETLVRASCESKHFGLARAAIEALGKIGDAASVAVLFECAELSVDRIFDHSLRYALFELHRIPEVAKFLDSQSSSQRKLALATLDLLSADEFLTAQKLIQAVQDEALSSVAIELLIKRPHHAEAALELLASQWETQLGNSPPPPLFEELAVGWRDQAAWQDYIADAMRTATHDHGWKWQEVALRSRAGLPVPPNWFPWVMAELQNDPARVAELLENVNLSGPDQAPLVDGLVALVHNQTSSTVKRQLLVSLPPQPLCEDQALVNELTASLIDLVGRGEPSGVVWKCLKRLKISRSVAEQVIALVSELSPAELIRAADLVASIGDDSLDQAMLQQLMIQKAARAIPTSSLINIYRARSPVIRALAKQVADHLLQSDPQVKQSVQALLERLPEGDQVRGLTLYHSSKANCGACHQMGYRGGKIGPELSKIGGSRTREALLEAIAFPSQRIEQGFDTMSILTLDGRILNGIVLSRSSNEINLRVSADKVETIPMAEIEELRASDVSIMPAGMSELLSPQEIADLLSLLEGAK